jgi:hypothetical protein
MQRCIKNGECAQARCMDTLVSSLVEKSLPKCSGIVHATLFKLKKSGDLI